MRPAKAFGSVLGTKRTLPFSFNSRKLITKTDVENRSIGSVTSRMASVSSQDEREKTQESILQPLRQNTELWLDLRNTKINPLTALAHLYNDLSGDVVDSMGGKLVDGILISKEQSGNIKDSGNGEKILYVNDKDGLLYFVNGSVEVKAGKCLSNDESSILPGSSLMDPTCALDCLVQGGWVFVDPMESDPSENDYEEKSDAVSNLIDFLANAVSAGPSLLLGGIGNNDLLGSLAEEDKIITNPYPAGEENGGVAVICRNKKELLNAGSSFKSFQLTSSSLQPTVSDGGIIIVTSDVQENYSQTSSSVIKFALVLPLEILLWRTAALILGEDDEEFSE